MIHVNPTDIAAEPAVAAASAATTGPARARAVVEQQIAMLTELARSGLSIAGAIERRALALAERGAEDSGVGGLGGSGDPAMAHARVARAVRLTLALQSRLLKDLIALDAAAAETAAVRAPAADVVGPEPEDDPLEARRGRIDRIVRRVVEGDEADPDEAERLTSLAWERLSDEDVYGDLLARPMGEIVARICEDLELSPDWTRLAREAWAVEEARSGIEGSPFVARTVVSADPAPTPTRRSGGRSVGRSAPAGGSP